MTRPPWRRLRHAPLAKRLRVGGVSGRAREGAPVRIGDRPTRARHIYDTERRGGDMLARFFSGGGRARSHTWPSCSSRTFADGSGGGPMAKLLWVGRNEGNVGGRSSKGYAIRRRGRSVVMRWGPVEVIGGGGRIHWLTCPQKRTRQCPSVLAAAQYVRRIVQAKETSGYDVLPGRVRIRRPRGR